MKYTLETKDDCHLVMLALSELVRQIQRNTWAIKNNKDIADLRVAFDDAMELRGKLGYALIKEAGEKTNATL